MASRCTILRLTSYNIPINPRFTLLHSLTSQPSANIVYLNTAISSSTYNDNLSTKIPFDRCIMATSTTNLLEPITFSQMNAGKLMCLVLSPELTRDMARALLQSVPSLENCTTPEQNRVSVVLKERLRRNNFGSAGYRRSKGEIRWVRTEGGGKKHKKPVMFHDNTQRVLVYCCCVTLLVIGVIGVLFFALV
ncbi:hypothetical protein BDD12DRAFT_887562 [Trichophaea hybrida]|nr:hypothetical protein BDD12DRAFT_887562 [Trichophaea hybrida]